MRAMLRHQDEAMLVEAKAVDAAYPLYGEIAVKDTNLAAALANRATAEMTARRSSKVCSTGSASQLGRGAIGRYSIALEWRHCTRA